MKLLRFSLLLFALLAFTSCIEQESKYTLNPDLSGKVEHQARFAPISFGNEDTESEAYLHSMIRQTLKQSEGVDSWKDLAVQRLDDGRIEFKGTAYFSDYDLLKLSIGGTSSDNKMSIEDQGGGKFRVAASPEMTDSSNMGDIDFNVEDIGNKSDADIAAELKTSMNQFAQMRPMMAGFLETMWTRESFTLPGKLEESKTFSTSPGTVTYTMKGKEMLAALDSLLANEDLLLEAAKAGEGDPFVAVAGAMFGGEDGDPAPEATFSGVSAPAFDYAAELASAKAGYAQMLTDLGLPAPPKQIKGAAGIENLEIGGLRLVRDLGTPEDARPFNWSPGLEIALIGKLPGSVLDVTGGRIGKLVSDTGEDLFDDDGFGRDINSVRVSEDDGVTVCWEMSAKIPAEKINGFAEISGELDYLLGSETEEIDLGFSSLAADAEGSQLNAKITTLEKSKWGDEGSWEIEISLAVDSEVIKSMRLLDAKGKQVPADRSGWGGGGGSSSYTLQTKGKAIPEGGKIILERYTDIAEGVLKFELKDVPLPF